MRAIGYVRVSTLDQATEGISLEAQEARIRDYARLYDIDLVRVIPDSGESAKTLERPGLRIVLHHLSKGTADGIVVAKLDRLTRSVIDWEWLIARFFGESAGKALMSVGEQIDTRTAGGRLVLRVLVTVAQWEREAIGERTRAALAEKVRQGEWVGGVPYGWRRDEPGGRLEADPEEQAVMVRMGELRAEGLSLRRIATVLNAAGVPAKRGDTWSAESVRRLVHRLEEDSRGD